MKFSMKKSFLLIVCGVCIVAVSTVSAQLLPVLGAQRAGTATAEFLKIGVGARATAMGESFVAIANDASAFLYGILPASHNSRQTKFILLIPNGRGYQARLSRGCLSSSSADAVGISVISLHMNDMPVTTEFAPFGNGNYFTFGDVAVGVTYSRKLTSQFSFGGYCPVYRRDDGCIKNVQCLNIYFWNMHGNRTWHIPILGSGVEFWK